ncbi:hypothetical protein [Aquimarina sp. 2201CG5-10]|uniref:hypothetical protein n=1 Tax=Aquimarina callyspongiae TaxID=3098150 RepID=UPI002AB32C71|nr:hypothetical protein [Aquimarina sp. 2201CG5-10]MDY8135465.1 hypothetical protein [Aquimarina sp. 2201CG5-10]
MKNIIKILIIILISTSCNSQDRTATRTNENRNQIPLNKNQYDKIPLSEIKEIFKLAIDLPELQQYFHTDQFPARVPLKILEFGDVNENSLKGLMKFKQPINLITKEEIENNQIQDYLGVGDWSPVNGKLRLQLYYPIEGITINYMFEKGSKSWKIIDSVIFEE